MKRFLFLVTLLVATIASYAHVWEIRVNQAQDGTLTWYLQSYHSAAETACTTNYPQSGLTINGVNYPIQSIASGDISALSSTVFAVNTSCGTTRSIYGIIHTPFLGTTLSVAPYSDVACWSNCNINAVGNFTPPPPPVCTTCPLTGWSSTLAASGNNNGTACNTTDDKTTATISVNHLACANITGDKQFSVVFDPGGANTTYGPFNYAAGVQTDVTINVPYGTTSNTVVKVVDADFPCEISHGLNIPGGTYNGEKETIPPVIVCGSPILVNVQPGTCGAMVTYSSPTASDNCFVAAGNLVFNYSGASVPWVVPAGVTRIKIKAWGAEGGSPTNNNGSCGGTGATMGGNGGYAEGTLTVTPGQTLYVVVGGAGFAGNSGGFNGGGRGSGDASTTSTGGGASDVRTGAGTLSDRVIVAGGGGGAEWSGYCQQAGAGGGLTGGTGIGDNAGSSGGAGTQTSGGAAGNDPCGWNPQAGGFGYGGNSASGHSGSGGGGYYGGGAGGCDGHGGGGSSYLGGVTGGLTTPGVQTGNGKIEISWDGSGGATIAQTSGLPSGSVFPVGTTTNTFVATDASGNTASCSFTVTVVDNQNPTITAPAAVTVNADNGSCSASNVNLGTPVTADNCGVASVTNNAPSSFAKGSTTVTWTVTDVNGRSATATQLVTVLDNQNPVINGMPGNINKTNDAGLCGAIVNWNAPGVSDNCPGATLVQVSGGVSGSLFPVGTTTVTYTATDASGNTVSQSFTITVTDNQAPVIACPFDIVVNSDAGQCGANVTYNQPSATDNCGSSGSLPTSIPGFTYKGIFNGHAYFLSNNQDIPENAHANSIALGGHLVTINSAAENAFVSAMHPDRIWIGFTDRDVEGTFRWVTNEPITYTNWSAGEPNNAGNEDWAVINWSGPTWNDWYYTQPAYYCVEFEGGSVPTTLVSGPASGGFFPVGTTTVTYKAVDPSGNTTSCSFNVTVRDNQPPSITCPANIVVSNAQGLCSQTVNFSAAASDNCGTVSVKYYLYYGTPSQAEITSPRSFAVGSYGVTVVATDAAGNQSNCAFTITVNDTEKPVINGENNNITVNFNAGSGAPASYTEAGITFLSLYGSTAHVHLGDNNNDGSPDILNHSGCCSTPYRLTVGSGVQFTLVSMEVKSVSSPGTFYVYPSGASVTVSSPGLYTFPAGFANVTEVRWQQDGGDMTIDNVIVSTKTQGVCPANIVKANDPGRCGANVSFSATATDNCSATVSFSQAPGSFFPVGTTPVTVTATDPSGNTSSCTFTVTVNDTEKPSLSGVPANTTVECTAVPAAAVVTATDNCPNLGAVQYSEVRTNGNCGGNYTLTRRWTVTDAHNNTTTASQVITVRDTKAPTLTAPADISVTNDAGQCGAKVSFAASATDACSNATITYSQQPGSFFPVGTTVVTVTARDDCSNATSSTFSVTVSDTEAPKLVGVPADATVECTAVPAAANVTATDNCPNAGAVQYNEVKANGNCAGNYTLTRTWTVTDAHGNTTSATQVITVQDTKAPVLTAPADITVSNDPGQCGAKVSYAGTAADDCSNAHITYSHQPGSFFAKGTTTVTVTATDDCGNASSSTFTVTVNDTENPVITCVGNQTRNTDAGKCSYATVGSEFDPSFGDNCPGSTVSNNYNSSSSLAGAIFPKGTTTVTWTVTDASGNTATCSSDVTVEDHENPTIVCVSNQSKVVDNAGCSYLVKGNEFDATFADNCPGSTVTNSYNHSSSLAGVSFPKGTTMVTWTVTDASGNTASCSYSVTVTTSLATFISSSNVLPQGTQPNTIYVGYTPAQTLTLSANPSGGGGGYTYNWSVSANLSIVGSNTGSTVQITTTMPGSSSAYQVNLVVTDRFGCVVSAQTWTVQVKDVRCGNKNDKVLVCQKTSSTTNPWVQICIAPAAVATHLGNGSTLGTCPTTTSRGTTPEPVVRAAAIKAYPNPSTGVFELQLQNYNQGKVEIQVIDNYGKLVAKQSLVVSASVENVSMDIRKHASGVYQVRVVSEEGVKTLKVVVAK